MLANHVDQVEWEVNLVTHTHTQTLAPGLSKIFSVKYDHTFSQLANHQIRHQASPQIRWAVSLVIAYANSYIFNVTDIILYICMHAI